MFGSNKVSWNTNNKPLGNDDELVRAIHDGHTNEVQKLVNLRGYSERELNSIQVDSHKNSLLHLAVMNNDSQLTTFFLEKGMSFTAKNKFGQSAWDLAVAFHNNEIMEKIIAFRVNTENSFSLKVNDLSSKVNVLETKNRELKRLSDGLEISTRVTKTELSDLTVRYNLRNREITTLTTENNELKVSNKRLRDENTELKMENNDLKDKNKKLKVSVETLMANTKK